MRARFWHCAALTALAMPIAAHAQSYGADGVTGGAEPRGQAMPSAEERANNTRQRPRIEPYIEANQTVLQELAPGSDTVTYTQLAAGVDASVQGRNNGGSASLRYERNIGYDDASLDTDTVTGMDDDDFWSSFGVGNGRGTDGSGGRSAKDHLRPRRRTGNARDDESSSDDDDSSDDDGAGNATAKVVKVQERNVAPQEAKYCEQWPCWSEEGRPMQ